MPYRLFLLLLASLVLLAAVAFQQLLSRPITSPLSSECGVCGPQSLVHNIDGRQCAPGFECQNEGDGFVSSAPKLTPTCRPRPKCLDATGSTRCLMPETEDMCPPEAFIFECPPAGRLDCMPGPGPAQPQCQKDYLTWIQSNCPDFEGVAY